MVESSSPQSAVAAGKQRRSRHLFGPDGRAVFVAMDHPGIVHVYAFGQDLGLLNSRRYSCSLELIVQ